MPKESTIQEWVVAPEDDGERLDRYLASRLTKWSRSKLQAIVKDGRVEVDGAARTKSSAHVQAGERVSVNLPPRKPLPSASDAARQLSILFEDEDLLVVEKPAGLLTHRTEGGHEITLAELATAHCGDLPSSQGEDRPGIVHRLDRDTSGVIVLGKNEESLKELMRQFRERETAKTYATLVSGEPRFASDWIETAIGRDPNHPERMLVMGEEYGGRPSSTFYEVQERCDGFTYLHCQPKTGRTHQIRVHLNSIGLEVIGDRVYRVRKAKLPRPTDDAPRSHRQMLHAFKLEFLHPRSGKAMSLESPLPTDFVAMLEWIRKPH